MLRIVFAIITGIVLWAVGFQLNPYTQPNQIAAGSIIESLSPVVYLCVLSFFVGFLTAIIADKHRIYCALASVFASYSFLALIVFSAASKEVSQDMAGPFAIVCASSLLFAGLGGVATKLLKIRLPFKI